MQDLLLTAAERAIRYRAALAERHVSPLPEALDGLVRLGGPLPAGPTAPDEVLALLDEAGSPATVASAGGRYFGFVTGTSLPVTLAAQWLAGAWDQNAVLQVSSPVAARLEEIALGWLRDLLALPTACAGGFVTGATMANFTALAAARHAVLAREGWDVEADGLIGAPPVSIVVGAEVHVSLLKALALLGFGRRRVLTVPVDDQGRLRADAVPPLRGPSIVCLQAGNVNSGACDPVAEICARAGEVGAWVHVDGAFGLWAAASPALAPMVEGVAAADSWATDAHKWLNVPYDCGLVFVRDPQVLSAAMAPGSAAYLAVGAAREPSHHTPEQSRRARGVEVWAALRSLGRAGVADLIERTCGYARQFATGLQAAGYRVLNAVVLNQVVVAFGDAEMTRRVIAAIQSEGTCWCGETTWQSTVAMRISVSSAATTESDVERSLEAMVRVARECGAHGG
jgi:glutamate/tyrosine decarboxylase-like PLP-dependent enzyme